MSEIKLYNDDCLPAMKQMRDNEFELAIIDPPYKKETNGLTAGYNFKKRKSFNYNTFLPPTKEYISELFRVSKNQIMWGFNYYLELLPNTDNVLVWNKHQNGHFSECELAWSSIKKTRIFDYAFVKDLYNKIHPTQKPIALYKWLLKNYANKGDKILDTHLGSGSIAIACYDMGFDLTGYEIDKEYFESAKKRFDNHKAQLTAQFPENNKQKEIITQKEIELR